jgi:hypothetical protein
MANNYPNLRPAMSLDFVNGIYVDSRVTFTRAGTRTYYGQEVVKAEENLLLQSQTFDNASWVKTRTTVTANTTVAPDGTLTADTITATAVNDSHFVNQPFAATGQHTLSVMAKAGTHSFLQVTPAGDNEYYANFDLTGGVVGTVGTKSTASIVALGDDWYRCIVTIDGSTASGGVSLMMVASDSSARFSSLNAVGTETIILWAGQVEKRSFATAYTATTTQPITRYQRQLKTAAANEWPREFDPVTGECLGRSVWESRTNLLQRSEEFDNAYWTQVAVTVSPNQIIAPDGTLTVDKLISTAVSGFHNINRSSGTRVASTAYTYSFFAKAAEIGFCAPNFSSALTGTALSATINLSTGAATSVSAGLTVRTVFVGNGFYRISITATGDANTTAFTAAINTTDAAGTLSHTGDGYSGIYIWGAQLEAGAFATPYIPTVASQVTRVADSAVMTGVNFSSWFNPSEGTFVVNSTGLDTSFTVALQVDDGTTSNRIGMIIPRASSASPAFIFTSGAAQTAFSNVTFVGDDKEALSYAANNVLLSVNGAAVQTDTTVVLPVVDRLRIRNNSAAPSSGYIKRLTYYPQALTAANLQAVTR